MTRWTALVCDTDGLHTVEWFARPGGIVTHYTARESGELLAVSVIRSVNEWTGKAILHTRWMVDR